MLYLDQEKNLLGETFACQGFRIWFPSPTLILIRCEEQMKSVEEPPSVTGLSYLYGVFYCMLELPCCWIKFLLRSQDLVVCLGIFMLLLLWRIGKKPHAWKLLKSSHREKVNSFLMMSLFGWFFFSPPDFCCQALFYGIMH